MANVISSLLVGIGFDFDKKSAREMESGMDSMKSKAMQLGGVIAGAFGIKALTVDFAKGADTLGKFGEVFGVNANEIRAFGTALETEGGSLESFLSQIESIERARARIRVGDVSFFAPAGKAGIDPNMIADAENATEAYLTLADQMKNLSAQDRINVAEALGLDEASIRLLSQGRDTVEALVSKYRNMRPLTDDMTEMAAEFNRNWIDTKTNVGLVADTVSARLIPALNSASGAINSWFGEDLTRKLDIVAGFVDLIVGRGDPEKMAEMVGGQPWMYKSGAQWFRDLTSSDDEKPEQPRREYPVSIGTSKLVSDDRPYSDYPAMGQPPEKPKKQEKPKPVPLVIDLLNLRGREVNVTPKLGELDDINVNPIMGDVPQADDQRINVSPIMGNVQQADDQRINVNPVMGNVQQADDQRINVSPIMGNVPQADDQRINVSPIMGNVPQADDQRINVNPVMGNVQQADDQRINVNPVMGNVQQADDQRINVNPIVDELNPFNDATIKVRSIVDDIAPVVPIYNAPPLQQQQRNDTPSSRNDTPSSRGSASSQTQTINVNMEMDGAVIDRKVIKIIDGMTQTTIDDITSNTAG